MQQVKARRGRRALLIGAGALAVGVLASRLTLGVIRRKLGPGQDGAAGGARQRFERAITINRPRREVFSFWRDFANLPSFMTHLVRVDVLDASRSHWVARAPMGRTIEWDAEIVAEEPGALIAWRSLPGSAVMTEGRVSFSPAPRDRGTEVRVSGGYTPPLGKIGLAAARVAGEEPDQQVREDLHRLKQVLECGEILMVDERPAARSRLGHRLTEAMRRRLATGARA